MENIIILEIKIREKHISSSFYLKNVKSYEYIHVN